MDRKLIQNKLLELETTPSSVIRGVVYFILHKAWIGVPTNNTRTLLYMCANDILNNPEKYVIDNCTTANGYIRNILRKRWDEIDLLTDSAFFNKTIYNQKYNRSTEQQIGKMSKEQKQQRLLELDDPNFLINELQNKPVPKHGTIKVEDW